MGGTTCKGIGITWEPQLRPPRLSGTGGSHDCTLVGQAQWFGRNSHIQHSGLGLNSARDTIISPHYELLGADSILLQEAINN